MNAAYLILSPVLIGLSSGTALKPPCKTDQMFSQHRLELFIEPVVPAADGILVQARLCVVPPRAGLGSYTAVVTFDSLSMQVRGVDVMGGMQVTNTDQPGTIRIAGAAPQRFPHATLATITFKLLRGTTLGQLKTTLLEANSPTGVSLMDSARVAGYPAGDRSLGVVQKAQTASASEGSRGSGRRSPPSQVLRIDSVSPKLAVIDVEGVTDLVLYGRGFDRGGNTVLFDGAPIGGLLSEAGGTIIRFNAPAKIPPANGLPARRLGAGNFEIKVRTSAGTSNGVTLALREERQ
jgi:hypothetical protein